MRGAEVVHFFKHILQQQVYIAWLTDSSLAYVQKCKKLIEKWLINLKVSNMVVKYMYEVTVAWPKSKLKEIIVWIPLVCNP